MEPSIPALLRAAERGDPSASEALFSALYSELHRVAQRELSRNGSAVTLGATSLLHQAYLDMTEREGAMFPDRNRFMAYTARVMRGLIIDYVRHKHAHKRGGQFQLTALSTDVVDATAAAAELEQVSEALDALSAVEPALAEVVDLKFFCGFSFGEIAAMHHVSERTIQRQWQKARVYLHHTLGHGSAVTSEANRVAPQS